jgi:Lon protease-like protein
MNEQTMPLPIFPLNTVLFPGMPLPLRIFEDRYLRMLADRASVEPAFVVSLIESGEEVGAEPVFHRIGTAARLVTMNARSTNQVDILVVGEHRRRISTEDWNRGYAMAEADVLPDREFDRDEANALLRTARNTYGVFMKGISRVMDLGFDAPTLSDDPALASFDIASRLPLHTWEQQAILEDQDPLSRIQAVTTLLNREVSLLYRGGMAGVPLQYPGGRFALN